MPASFAQNENGITYAATGFDAVKRWDGITALAETAGVAAPTLPITLAGADDGAIFGTYFAYVRFVDRLGNVSNLSPVSEALVLSAVSGTITTIINVTVVINGVNVTYSRLHSTGISSLLTNGNVVVIDGVSGMTGIDGTWFYYDDPNGGVDDFLLQAGSSLVLATGTYTSGGTWVAASGTINNVIEAVAGDGTHYSRLSANTGETWSKMRDGQSITIASVGGVSGINGTWAYWKDAAGSTNDFFITNLPARQQGSGTYTADGGKWHGGTVAITNIVEVVDSAGTRYSRLTAPGIWSVLSSGDPVQVFGVSGITGLNGEWTFQPIVTPFGTTDDFYVTSGGTKQLGATPYTGGGTWSGTTSQTGTITAAFDAVTSGYQGRFTSFTSTGIDTGFTSGDRITLSGFPAGPSFDCNGTWFMFKPSHTSNQFSLSTSVTGTPRFRSAASSDFTPNFTAGELAGNSRIRSAAVGATSLLSAAQVVDAGGSYTRLKATGIWNQRQEGDDVTIAGITGEFADLNGTWTWHKDATAGTDGFYLKSAGVTKNASVTYTFGGTYADRFGDLTSAENVVVSGVTYTRITATGISTALANGDNITLTSTSNVWGLDGDWLYQSETATDTFFVVDVPVRILGTGTYTSGGTWVGPNGTISAASEVTVSDTTYTRMTSAGIALKMSAGNQITLAGMAGAGLTGIDGDFFYYPDPNGAEDTFFVQSASAGILGVGDYSGGASWNKGFGQINFTNVAVPASSQVTRRQILRNADGNTTAFYIDIDTTDLTGTAFSSNRIDSELRAQESVPLFDENQLDLAVSRYGVPPDDLPLLLNARNRLLFTGSAVYLQGAVAVVNGSATATGIGTEWTTAMVDRCLCISGEVLATITAVDVTTQTLTLGAVWAGATSPFAEYSIRSAESRRRMVAWSEAGLPEAVATTSAFQVSRDKTPGDITGAFLLGPLVYLTELERTHVFNFNNNPAPSAGGGDGSVYLGAYRGCVNQRCVVIVEEKAYLLDHQGIHVFTGNGIDAISTPIQDIVDQQGDYERRINWTWSEFFHAVHDLGQEVIRWFVNMDCRKYPHHAVCLDYRSGRWWLEEYPFPVCCSVAGSIDGRTVVFVGSTAGRVFALAHGQTDGIDPATGTTHGTATGAGFVTLTDSAALFPECGGLAVTISGGTGKGQRRIIASNTATVLTMMQPWTTIPDATSRYAIGGIDFDWKSGVFRFLPKERENVREVELLGQSAATGEAALRLFLNRSETAMTFGQNIRDKGVTTSRDDDEAVLDLTKSFGCWTLRYDGQRQQSLDGDRFLEVELAGTQVADSLVFREMTLEGVNQ